MAITPESKDWTWVVDRGCPECGFDPTAVAFEGIPGLVQEKLDIWPGILDGAEAATRPDANTWSPVEYAAHVRDMSRVFHGRVTLMLEQDDPLFEDWDQDAAAVAGAYLSQDPATVSAELRSAGERAAAAFAAVPEGMRRRAGRRGDGTTPRPAGPARR